MGVVLSLLWVDCFLPRILMEVMSTEVRSFLGIKDDTTPSPLKCFPRFLDLMAILDDVQYNCSGGKTLSGPAHVP